MPDQVEVFRSACDKKALEIGDVIFEMLEMHRSRICRSQSGRRTLSAVVVGEDLVAFLVKFMEQFDVFQPGLRKPGRNTKVAVGFRRVKRIPFRVSPSSPVNSIGRPESKKGERDLSHPPRASSVSGRVKAGIAKKQRPNH